jgi:hypothetical protein
VKAGAALLIGAAVRGDRCDQKTPRALHCSTGPEWPTHRGRAGNAARASALCGLAQARAREKESQGAAAGHALLHERDAPREGPPLHENSLFSSVRNCYKR